MDGPTTEDGVREEVSCSESKNYPIHVNNLHAPLRLIYTSFAKLSDIKYIN